MGEKRAQQKTHKRASSAAPKTFECDFSKLTRGGRARLTSPPPFPLGAQARNLKNIDFPLVSIVCVERSDAMDLEKNYICFFVFCKVCAALCFGKIPDLNTRIDNDIQTNINNSINNSTQTATNTNIPNDINNSITKSFNNTNLNTRIYDYTETSSIKRWVAASSYPVVIINWVQYLGPPGPFSFPDSRDLLEVLGGLPWQRERGGSLEDPPGP